MNQLFREAAEIVAGESISIEPDGSIWANSDARKIDKVAVEKKYEELVTQKEAMRADAVTKLKLLGLTTDDLYALGITL